MTSTSNRDASIRSTTSIKPSANRPILLVLDFDGTLSLRDTMHLVAEAGYAHQRASNTVPQPTPWSEIVDAYMTDFRAHTSSYKPQASERISPEQESAWLRSMNEIEEASIERACTAGIFDKVTSVEMEDAGRQALRDGRVQLRGGWERLLASVYEHNAKASVSQLPCRILSVNWSETFIRGVVGQALEEQQTIKPPTLDQHVYANEIPSILDENSNQQENKFPSTRKHIPIRTSNAKVNALRSFRKDERDGTDTLIIYVGDSSTDLDCLLEADIGFCIHDEPLGSGQKESAEICQRIGVDIRPSTDFDGQSDTRGRTLLHVKDFTEILDCLRKNGIM